MTVTQRAPTRDRNARERIVAAAAELFHDNGYAATGLDQILVAAQSAKGSFYHHFGSKKEIALAVIKEVVALRFTRRMIDPVATATEPLAAIRTVIRTLRTKVVAKDLVTGCPINNLASELAMQDSDLQRALAGLFEKWRVAWTDALKRDPNVKRLNGVKDPHRLSTYLIAAIEGGLAMAKAQQSREPLDITLKQLERMLMV